MTKANSTPRAQTGQRAPESSAAVATPSSLRRLRWQALGTQCEVLYVCDDAERARVFEAEAVRWVADFESKYSRFRTDSLVSRINASAGNWVEIDEETERLFDLSNTLHRLTDGVLDVTALPLLRLWDYRAERPKIPSETEIAAARRLVGWEKVERTPGRVRLRERGMSIDFGGWGKEYAVDRVADIARRHEITQALIDFGHDLFAIGTSPGKPAWHIGLEDPAKPGDACWSSVAARDCGVASSGDYLRGFTLNGKRYGHIVDPRTGWPVANGCRQVTVIAKTCLQAGALSTSVFILGPEAGLRLVEDLPGSEACALTEKARHQTRGFLQHVVTN